MNFIELDRVCKKFENKSIAINGFFFIGKKTWFFSVILNNTILCSENGFLPS